MFESCFICADYVRCGSGVAPTYATSTRMAFVSPSRPLDTARVLDCKAGLALHEFPRTMVIPAGVSNAQLTRMVGNCQHVRAAAAAWVVGAALLTPGRGQTTGSSSKPAFFMRVKRPCGTQSMFCIQHRAFQLMCVHVCIWG